MKSKLLGTLLTAVALITGIVAVTAQQPDDDVRGAFLESRPDTTNLSAPRRRRKRPSNTNANANANANKSPSGTDMTMANANAANNNRAPKQKSQAIGLGYTLFMRDADGRGVRVEPTREFRTGEGVRLALEPNIDGYLYIFDSEDGGPVRMLYPDWRLDAGDNWIEAHVPIEVPASEQKFGWFNFTGKPGGDRVYVVLSREPLKSVPTAEDLMAFCGLNKDKCPWQPSAEIWQQIEKAAKADVKVAISKNFGQVQTETEKVATTRGLELDKSAPQPSVVRINASTTESLLVTVLDLVHK